MEVKRNFGRTLLLAAIFGAASITMADEGGGYISTDSSADTAAIEAVDADVPTAAPAPAATAQSDVIESIVHHDTIQAWNIIELSGFINGGAILNTHGAEYNMVGCNSDRDFQMNTAYIRAVKKAQTGRGALDWGFGADTLIGSEGHLFRGYTGLDSDWTTGHRSADYNQVAVLSDAERENYAGAMPQLYGEFTVNNWDFKAGRFYGLMGYEGPGDSRFFYTYGRAFELTPVTHTGAIATFSGIQNVDLSVGWVMGENNMFSRLYDESLITGAVKIKNGDWFGLKYAFLVGDGALGGTGGDLFRNDVVLNANLGNCWETALLYNYGKFDGESPAGEWGKSATLNDLAQLYGSLKYQTYGGYLYYTLNQNWKVGTRGEWQRGKAEGDAMEIYEFTLGANWTPTGYDNFAIRPEIRYDKVHTADGSGYEGMFGNGLVHDDQFTLACDMIYKF